MIPKKIHYCWFGGAPLPELALKCLESWKKFCPEYEIIQCNEQNFDVNSYAYTREAYGAKKWAFVSDVARLYALVHEGGVYMDTDVELLGSLDGLLKYEGVSGFESGDRVSTGLMACQQGQPLFLELLAEYDGVHFLQEDGAMDLTTNVERITRTCLKYGLRQNNEFQIVRGCALFPSEYFCPKDPQTGVLTLTEKTLAIHHFDGSWLSAADKLTGKLRRKLQKVFSEKMAGHVARFLAVAKCKGCIAAVGETVAWLKRRRG